MFKKIMIMVDNSAIMQDVLNYVTTLFPESYYCLYSIVNLGAFSGYYTKIVQTEMRKMSNETINTLSSILESKNLKFNSYIDQGEPVSTSLSYAKKNNVDLFVMETHAGLSTNKIKLGTTTAAIIAHSHIPLFLLGEDLVPVKNPRILHPTTGSRYSEKATYIVAEIAKSMESSLTTLILRGDKEEIKEGVIEIFRTTGVESKFHFADKDEIASLIELANSNDIIIGSRGSPRPTYRFRFFVRSFAIDPTVRLTVSFLPKPLLLVCD